MNNENKKSALEATTTLNNCSVNPVSNQSQFQPVQQAAIVSLSYQASESIVCLSNGDFDGHNVESSDYLEIFQNAASYAGGLPVYQMDIDEAMQINDYGWPKDKSFIFAPDKLSWFQDVDGPIEYAKHNEYVAYVFDLLVLEALGYFPYLAAAMLGDTPYYSIGQKTIRKSLFDRSPLLKDPYFMYRYKPHQLPVYKSVPEYLKENVRKRQSLIKQLHHAAQSNRAFHEYLAPNMVYCEKTGSLSSVIHAFESM